MYKNIHPNPVEENCKINPSKQLMSISQIFIMSVSCARKYNDEQETAPALTEPNNGQTSLKYWPPGILINVNFY